MKKYRYLLQEDDCAPDALEYFILDMKEQFGLDFSEFMANGKVESEDLLTVRRYKGYALEFSGDDPFYKLRKDGEVEK